MNIFSNNKANEITYRIGQLFISTVELGQGIYILACVDDDKRVCLIGLNGGNRYDNPIRVKDLNHITVNELLEIGHGATFTHVTDNVYRVTDIQQ